MTPLDDTSIVERLQFLVFVIFLTGETILSKEKILKNDFFFIQGALKYLYIFYEY